MDHNSMKLNRSAFNANLDRAELPIVSRLAGPTPAPETI
jgi:hypothetical protein